MMNEPIVFRPIWLGVAVLCAGLFSTSAPVAAAEKAKVSGAALYAEHCATCHGAEGRGNGPMAGEMKVAPSDLTLIRMKGGGKLNDTRLREVIDGRVMVRAHGSRDMPVWGYRFSRDRKQGEPREQVSRAQTHALADYVVSLQVAKPAAKDKSGN